MLRHLAMLVLLATALHADAQEQVVVIAHLTGAPLELERHEVRNLFMGTLRQDLKPVALAAEHPARVMFNTRIVGLTESRIQSYWAQMRFTGRGGAPREFPDSAQLLAYLLETPGAVGYVLSDTEVPEGLSVIYRSN